MKAVRLNSVGGLRNLHVEEIAMPRLRKGEALVRIRAAALNRRDVFIAQGLYPNIRVPVTLGSDGAGEIAELNAASCDLRVGDAVVINPMLGWGEDPSVWDNESRILGMPSDGTFAQYVAVPAENVYRIPGKLSMEEAAAVPLGGLTAYRALFTRGAMRRSETVLITGVGGGVQTFVLLFAKAAGTRAIVTSGSDDKLERAKALGADLAVNYRSSHEWQKALRSEHVDLVIDSSGGETLRKALEAVRPGGRIVVYGGTAGDATIKMFSLFWKHVSILGTSMGSPEDFVAMLRLFADGLRPVIDEILPVDDVVLGAQRLEAAQQFGKIVLRVD